jgi:hypothetical protein
MCDSHRPGFFILCVYLVAYIKISSKRQNHKNSYLMKNSALMMSVNTSIFRQNNSLILKLTNGQRNSYLCNQLGNALFCVTSGIFAGRAQRDPAKSHELHKIAFPNVLHTRFFLILTKKSFFKR